MDYDAQVADCYGSSWRIRRHKVNDASGQRLIPAIIESVQPNSEVFTDAWEGYNQLAASGYKHRVLRKTSDVGKNLLPLVNLVALC